jgi:hypothetical protein
MNQEPNIKKGKQATFKVYKNDFKTEPNHPDFVGKGMVGEQVLKIAIWKTEDEKEKHSFSLSATLFELA